jgi:hypothetical protein
MDTDVLIAKLLGEISDRALQGGLGQTHEVVFRHDLVRAIVVIAKRALPRKS